MWSWTVSLVAFLNFLPRLWQSMRFLDLYWYDRKNKVESPSISNLVKCFFPSLTFEVCVPFHIVQIYLDLIIVASLEAECYMFSNWNFWPKILNFHAISWFSCFFLLKGCQYWQIYSSWVSNHGCHTQKCKSQGFTHVVNEQWTSWQTRYKVAGITLQSWTERDNLQVRHIRYWQCSLSWRWVTYLYSHGTSKSVIHILNWMCLFQLLRVRTGKVILVEVLL